MIGHYLLTLSEEQEDRVLTRQILPGSVYAPTPCLMGAAGGFERGGCKSWPQTGDGSLWMYVGSRYDYLCRRFGVVRVNGLIRNRILSNRARRTLENRPEHSVVSR